MLAPFVILAALQPAGPGQQALARLAEEAGIFAREARNLIGEETLQQKAYSGPSRFQPGPASAGLRTPPPRVQAREIVSEYGYTSLKDSPDSLREVRRVISVDGRRVSTKGKTRETLTLDLRKASDKEKKRLLEEFARHGLAGAAVDFGQMIVLFREPTLNDYKFQFLRDDRLGADAVAVYAYEQKPEAGKGFTLFEGRKVHHQSLRGEVWCRTSDSTPIRITLSSAFDSGSGKRKVSVRHEAVVDYQMTAHKVLAPASVVHRQFTNDRPEVENVFRYSAFRKFSSSAEIKFTGTGPAPQ